MTYLFYIDISLHKRGMTALDFNFKKFWIWN